MMMPYFRLLFLLTSLILPAAHAAAPEQLPPRIAAAMRQQRLPALSLIHI